MTHRIASKAASKSEHKQHHLGAVIVKGGRILATGHNQMRPSKVMRTKTLHAEAHAVLQLLKSRRQSDLVNADIYVNRFTRGGRIGLARPCQACMELLRTVGIRRVFYTTNNGDTMMEKVCVPS